MAISKLTGPMLSNVLVRDGQGLAFSDSANSTPTLYIDIANARIGVNTNTPTADFTINGAGYASSLNLTNNISLGGDVIANGNAIITNITASGNVSTVNITATGFANAVNISASGNINATANIIAGNVNSINISASGNINSVNVSASGNINSVNMSSSGNIIAGNVNANGLTSTSNLNVSGSANISSLSVVNISVSGNITGNSTTSTTGNIDAGNLNISNTATLGNIVINNTTISPIGNVVIFAGVTGIAVPVGNTSQRPGSPVSGTMRFNTENNDLETWSGTEWVNTAAQFTQILDQQITGDNSTTYALEYPTDDSNSIIVSINGITQRPGAAYNVVGTNIEFANPLLTSEVADIRYLTYPVPVGEYGNANVAAYLATNTANLAGGNILSDNYLYANGTPISFGGSYSNANVIAYANGSWAGNIIPSANVTYSLGNATNQWKDLWVSNNTIYVNSVPLTVTSSNVLQVGGANVITANSSTTGNITATNFIGSGSLLTNLPVPTVAQDITSNGAMSLMTYDGNLKYVSYATVEPSSGNITGGNISATGNIRGNFFIGNGSQLTGITGSANTGNVTFNDVNIIGTGNLKLQPNIANNEYLDIYLTAAADIHIAAAGAGPGNVILGTDEGSNVAVLWEGNVAVQAGNVSGTQTWNFDTAGNLTLPSGGVVYETNIPDGGLNGNTIALAPSGGTNADQQLLIYPTTNDANHLHLTTGNLYSTELFLGSDDLYVKLANTGNVVVNSNDNVGNAAQWTFDTTGNTTFPANGTTALHNITSNGRALFGTVQIGGNLNYEDTANLVVVEDKDGFADILAQNKNSGANASMNIVLVNDQSGNSYMAIGINSSGFTPFYNTLFELPSAGYISHTTNQVIGPQSSDSANSKLFFTYSSGSSALELNANGAIGWGATYNGNLTEGNFGNTGQVLTSAGNSSPPTWSNVSTIANGTSNINIATANGNVTITSNSGNTWTFNTNGNLTAPGNISAVGKVTANTVTTNTVLTLAIYADNAARDATITSPTAGMLIFNTGAASFQGYNGTSWGNLTLS